MKPFLIVELLLNAQFLNCDDIWWSETLDSISNDTVGFVFVLKNIFTKRCNRIYLKTKRKQQDAKTLQVMFQAQVVRRHQRRDPTAILFPRRPNHFVRVPPPAQRDPLRRNRRPSPRLRRGWPPASAIAPAEATVPPDVPLPRGNPLRTSFPRRNFSADFPQPLPCSASGWGRRGRCSAAASAIAAAESGGVGFSEVGVLDHLLAGDAHWAGERKGVRP